MFLCSLGPVAAPILRLRVTCGDRLRRALAELEPVAEWQVIDHVHHLELEAARLAAVAVPQRDDAALLRRIEEDQRAVAVDPAAVADDVVAGIIIAAPAVAVPGSA